MYTFVLAATLIVSVPVSSKMEKKYGEDASYIVLDEIVGMQIVFTASSPSLGGVLLGFFLFRVFDVIKPFPVRRSQDLPRGYGVVCDDFLAGLYVRLLMIILAYFFSGIGEFI